MLSNSEIKFLDERKIKEFHYEYGAKWIVRIMIISKTEKKDNSPVRCEAGAGASPPDFLSGPLKYRRMVLALGGNNDMELQEARLELGPDFNPDEFDIRECNIDLNSKAMQKQ